MSDNPAPKRLGYARVSTVGQTLEAQLEQLKAAGCSRIYREKVSGAKVDRKELSKLVKSIAAGDQVVVTRIDRLARSTFELFAIVKRIIDAGGQFLSLAEPGADTSTSTGRPDDRRARRRRHHYGSEEAGDQRFAEVREHRQ